MCSVRKLWCWYWFPLQSMKTRILVPTGNLLYPPNRGRALETFARPVLSSSLELSDFGLNRLIYLKTCGLRMERKC